MKAILKSIDVGMRRHWRTGIARAFGVAGAIWLVTEILIKVSVSVNAWVESNGNAYLSFVIAAALLWFVTHVYETRSISFNIPTTKTRIEIRYGDLFSQDSHWLIGVGEFFDDELGNVVAPNSLHGQLIVRFVKGGSAQFRSKVDASLLSQNAKGVKVARPIKPNMRYSIGTTAAIDRGAHLVFLVAMANTDLVTAKASSSVPMVWDAINGALRRLRAEGNNASLSLPLIGSGVSNVNIEPQHLLRLIVLAIVDFGRKSGLPDEINIILHEGNFASLDLREIKRDWSC